MEKNTEVPRRSKEYFINYMEQLLLMHFFLPGERLPAERELAQQMKLSRPVIHEGLLELGARGLISIRPRHGWIVNNFTQEGSLSLLNSLYRFSSSQMTEQIDAGLEELRSIVLTESLKKYFETADKDGKADMFCDDLTRINEHSKKIMKGDEIKPSAIQKATKYDFLFYRRIIEESGNIVFTLLFNSSRELYYEKLGAFFTRYPDSLHKAADLKEQLIAAIRRNAAKEAQSLLECMTSHNAYQT